MSRGRSHARDEIVDLHFDHFLSETDKAWKLKFGTVEQWVPKSLGEIDIDKDIVTLPTWFVEKEGLDPYVV